jgi:hypothetical protein
MPLDAISGMLWVQMHVIGKCKTMQHDNELRMMSAWSHRCWCHEHEEECACMVLHDVFAVENVVQLHWALDSQDIHQVS